MAKLCHGNEPYNPRARQVDHYVQEDSYCLDSLLYLEAMGVLRNLITPLGINNLLLMSYISSLFSNIDCLNFSARIRGLMAMLLVATTG